MGTPGNIKLSLEGRTARIALCRPEKRNALDWSTIKEILAALDIVGSRPDLHFVVVTGSGGSFSAGGDLEGYLHLYRNPAQFLAFLEDFHRLLAAIEASPKIFIAAVNGVCVAGGLELILACDLVVAADTARIGDGHLNFGQLPGAGGSQRLPLAVGLSRAKQLILTGDLLSAAEAERIGLVTELAPAEKLDTAVETLIAKLARKSPAGLRGAKHLVNATLTHDLADGLRHEIEVVHRYATTEPDAIEGLVAFREKRKPDFSV